MNPDIFDHIILHCRPRALSVQRLKVLKVINYYETRVGYSPTIRELAGHLQFNSHASVYAHLDRLRTDGFLSSQRGRARSWRVTAKGRHALARSGMSEPQSSGRRRLGG